MSRNEQGTRPPLGPNRRTVLGLLTAGTVTAVAGSNTAQAQPAPAAAGRPPRTLARSGGTGVLQPGFAIDYVGVRYRDGATGGRIRFANRTGRLGPWQTIPLGCAAAAGDTAITGTSSALISAGRAPAYQVDLPPGAVAVALNCTDGPPLPTPPAGTDRTLLAGPPVLSRAAWGADESLRFDETGAERFPPTYWPLQTVTVHHTATTNNDPDPAARVRAIYRFQTIDQDFGDIGYHFLIDEAGRIYEGRWSGDDGTPAFDPAGNMVTAAHVGGFNAGNIGIALLGTFTDQPPTDPARQSLTQLLATILDTHHIDPLATVNYLNPVSGVTRTVSTVPGHQDWAATLCPGDQLADQLTTIRKAVADLIAGQPPTT